MRAQDIQFKNPIRIHRLLERERSHYLRLHGDRVVMRGVYGGSVALLILALLLPSFCWWIYQLSPVGPPPIPFDVTSANLSMWGLSALTAALGWWFWPRTVVIRADDWLHVPGCRWEGRWRGPLHPSDISAVQICDSPDAYQVNLVAKGPEHCRVNVLCDGDPDRAEYVAMQLARLLRVPLETHWRAW